MTERKRRTSKPAAVKRAAPAARVPAKPASAKKAARPKPAATKPAAARKVASKKTAAKKAAAKPATARTTTHARTASPPRAERVWGLSERPQLAVVKTRAGAAKPALDWGALERTNFLIDTVGGVNELARTLGVSASQPSRWRTGEEVPSPEVAARLLDLDHVIALAMQAWHPLIVMDWMTTANAFLDGATPAEVLSQRGSAEVIDALKATISGAYA
jgi:hypothetical protein